MKKPNIHTILGSSRRDCVLIILFQLYDSKSGPFAGNLFGVSVWHSPPPPPPPPTNLQIGRRTNPIFIQHNTILKQPIQNNSKLKT